MKSEKKLLQKLRQKAGHSISQHKMIEEGDRILVGLSGGKDSLCLLDVLAERLKYKKEKYQLFALHVNVENLPYTIDKEYIIDFCKERNVPFYYKSITIDFEKKDKKECFICSWRRRGELFSYAEKLNCNKIALGHHLDDALETLLMNMIFHGSISSLPGTLSMFDNKFSLIRPLIRLSNNEALEYSKILDFKLQEKTCPHERMTQRAQTAELLLKMEALKPGAKANIFKAMNNIYPDYLPK